MFFYDSQAGGGSGIVEVVAEKFGVLLEKAQQIISGCGCSEGRPSCIQLFHCEKQNEPRTRLGIVGNQPFTKIFRIRSLSNLMSRYINPRSEEYG